LKWKAYKIALLLSWEDNMRHGLLVILTLSILAIFPAELLSQERKRTPALREQVYSQLSRAQQLADGGDIKGGLAVLATVESKLKSMNSYERAMLWNFYGFMHYGQDDIATAISYFSKVVEEDPIPDALLQGTLFSLAQLALGQERYQDSLDYLAKWQQVVGGEPQAKALVLRAQALYQMKRYDEALSPILAAIEASDKAGQRPDENWYVLARAIYFELDQIDRVAEILVQMIKHYNKAEYWVQLAGVYAQLGEDKKQLAVLEAAQAQGYLTKGQDILNLAQAYFVNDIPYKAALTLAQAIADQKVEANLRNLKLLAQSWVAARETDKAVAALAQAAALSDDGELDAQRAQVLLNAERNDEAMLAAQQALEKGGLKQPGNMHLVIGMAALNKADFNVALKAFAAAKQFDEVRRTATQWERYASAEKEQAERIEALKRS
jgi:tetratricopeptide (TPR) repeat protein